jgi:uncharacterized damage-inducible protein DinB
MMKRLSWFERKFHFDLTYENFGSVLKNLREKPELIARLVSSLPVEILTKKIENRWSIQENIGHLFDLEELHEGRIDDFIAGKEMLRPADLNNRKTDQANHNSKSIEELVSQFKYARENFVKRLKHLDRKTLERNSIHPRLNQPMRPIDMAQFVLEHDEHHIETIKELIDRYSIYL